MNQKILIAGSGFAGLWAALSASRAVALAGRSNDIEVIVISPEPKVVIRPRLYEPVLDNMAPDISALLEAVGAKHIAAKIDTIDTSGRTVSLTRVDGRRDTIDYDRFVLAAGSQLFRPKLPGLDHAFDTDQLSSAQTLDAHLRQLGERPETDARNTVVVAGGGFTGLEAVTEMPARLRAALGDRVNIRVILIDTEAEAGRSAGVAAMPFVQDALAEAGVEARTGVRVAAVGADSVTLSSGETIATNTVVWTAGMRANPLAAQIAGEHDGLGRVVGDVYLRASAAPGVFVTGDVVNAATDDAGNQTVMSCQHALSLGRVAGHNAAAELVGLPLHPYSQPKYVTCLDLGPWGALFTEGWDRQVRLTREEGKKVKREINTMWIYPPAPDRDAVFAVANPDYVIVA